MKRGITEILAMLAILLGLFAAGCGSTSELTSSWRTNEITIDGSATEWTSGMTELKDSHVFIGARNDQDFFYFCMVTSEDQFRRQMLIPGLTIWFEPDNGKKFGILYPMGIQSPDPPAISRTGNTRDPEDRSRLDQLALQDLEILGPGKDDRNLVSTLQLPGFSVKIGNSGGKTAYELKIPLHQSTAQPYALPTTGGTIRVGIQTGKFESRMRQGGDEEGERGGGGFPGGGRMGRGRSGGGRMGGGRSAGQGGGANRPEPLDLKADIHLASQGSGSVSN